MRVDDEVLGGVEEGRPEVRAFEVVLQHDGDAPVELLDLFEDAVHVGQDPVGAGVGEAGGGAEAGEVGVGGFVDGGEGEGVLVAGVLDKLEDFVDGFEGVVEVGGVLEPVAVAEGFADVEAVDAAGEGVQPYDHVHVVHLDRVLCDGAEVFLLVAGVELRAGDLDPGSVCGGDAEGVYPDGGEFVDGGGVEERGIASLECRATLGPKVAAERPLIRSTWVERVEPLRVMGLLLGQPAAEVGAVGLVGLPVDVVATVDTLGPVDGGAVSDAASCFLNDVEWTLVMVLDDCAVAASGVGVQYNADLLQEGVQA